MLTELLDEIEERFRRIIREEIRKALLEANDPEFKPDNWNQIDKENPVIKKEFPTLLTAPDVAELLGVKVSRVYELTRTRKTNGLPVIIIGERSYRYSKEQLLKWLKRDSED